MTNALSVSSFFFGFYKVSSWLNEGQQGLPAASIMMMLAGIGFFTISALARRVEKPPLLLRLWEVIKLPFMKWSLFIMLLSEAFFLAKYKESPRRSLFFAMLLQLPFLAASAAYLWIHRKADEHKNTAKA